MTESAVNRRSKAEQRRDHRVGPLRLNDKELRMVQMAAHEAGLSVGAYATAAVVRAAHGELHECSRQEPLEGLNNLHALIAIFRMRLNATVDKSGRMNQLDEALARVISEIRGQQAR